VLVDGACQAIALVESMALMTMALVCLGMEKPEGPCRGFGDFIRDNGGHTGSLRAGRNAFAGVASSRR
jgi:hypothetical protein